ncbi:hypothetical protein VNO78_12559 [Psophocarpus tetragonolobus]|uniref:Uncharacterized protein n=1 Tax=Psophocarpus tetragonolobus TaxID=3891 RepID=A0AAN9SWB2_PSOTE
MLNPRRKKLLTDMEFEWRQQKRKVKKGIRLKELIALDLRVIFFSIPKEGNIKLACNFLLCPSLTRRTTCALYFSSHIGFNKICSFLFIAMTKKSSKKTPSQLPENIVAEEEKPPSTTKKAGNEIDEIFAGKKRKKSETEKTGKPDEVTKRTGKTKKKKKNVKRKTDGSDDGEFANQPSRPRKKTEDGLSIYTEEELGISNADAGNTPLCPFDCSCCF